MTTLPWLQVIGDAYVILAIDLATFVTEDSIEDLEQIRGRSIFDAYLESLPNRLKSSEFKLSKEYQQRERRGYGLGIFNHLLAEDNFAPTYRVSKEQVNFPKHLLNNVQFKDRFLPVWNRWNFYLRISSNGIITIILHLNTPKYRDLELLVKDVIGLQHYFDRTSAKAKIQELTKKFQKTDISQDQVDDIHKKIASVNQLLKWVQGRSMSRLEDEQSPVVWQLAVDMAQRFIKQIGGTLSVSDTNGKSWTINLKKRPNPNMLRESYTIYSMQSMRDRKHPSSPNKILHPTEMLKTPVYQKIVASITEGVLLHGRKAFSFPQHNPLAAQKLIETNLATWKDEFCIITGQAAIIYHQIPQKTRVAFSSREIPYEEYWSSLLRLLEFGLEVKVLAQLLENQTAQALTLRLSSTNKQEEQNPVPDKIEQKMLNASRLLAHTRKLNSAPVMGQANYAINKYEHLLECLDVPAVLMHAEINLRSMSRLLERSVDLRIQTESQRVNETALAFSLVFAGVSLIMGFLAFPSFINDWEAKTEFLSQFWFYPYLGWIGVGIVLSLTLISFVSFGFALWMFIRQRKRRRVFW